MHPREILATAILVFATSATIAQPNGKSIEGVSNDRIKEIQLAINNGESPQISEIERKAVARKQKYCRDFAFFMSQAVGSRNANTPPQATFKKMKQLFPDNEHNFLTDKQMKELINSVYFDPDFSLGVIPNDEHAVSSRCMFDFRSQFQPLK